MNSVWGTVLLVDRGIGQVYVDGIPQGIPMDMRYSAGDSRVGGLYNGGKGWRNKEENSSGIYTTEELEENARVMKNNGYYSGPKSVFYGNDGNDAPRYSANTCTIYYNQDNLMRRKICNVKSSPTPTIPYAYVPYSPVAKSGNFTLDYMELVPIDICGAGGLGEDLY